MINKSESTAVILCGGLSTRMKTPKYKLFLDSIIPNLTGFNNIALSVRDEQQITDSKFTLWPDCVKDCGPLGGILTALKMSASKFIFVTSCDVPGISANFIDELYFNLNESDNCLIPVLNGKIQPLTGIYNKSCIKEIESAINAKIFSVKKFLANIDVHYLYLDNNYKDFLVNLNTPEDYRNWLLNKEILS